MGSQGLATLDIPAATREKANVAPGNGGNGGYAVKRLTLTDFRCYHHQRLAADKVPVVLTGPTCAGKTNLLEVLSFLVPRRGLRGPKLSDVVRREEGREEGKGAPSGPLGVAASVHSPQGEVEIGTGFEAGRAGGRDKRIVRVDGQTVKSQAVLAEHLSALWLTPQMDRLFLEGPGSRRRFLDRLVFDSDPAHLGRVNAYEHAMRERMALLRANGDKAWVETLEDTMATRGVAVAAARLEATRRLGDQLKESTGAFPRAFPRASVEVAGTVEDWLREGPALAAEDKLRAALCARRANDAAEGRAAIGPHRSDLKVLHLGNGRPAELCSTGEQKALLVALVLGTAKMRAYEQGTAPLLLLDEIAAHLDEIRLEALFDEISCLGAQVWLTGTDAGLFAPLAGRAQFFAVNDGTITPQD